ncbi:MAG: FecR domain-containing protein [Gemmatimonadaceae bacterium]
MRALAVGPLLLLLAASPDVGEIGRIKSSIGTATVERGSAPIAASIGQELLAGDWLVTGKDGRMSLTLVDDTRFAVGPDSRIALKKFEYDPTTQKGSFIAKVERGSIAVVSGRITKSGRSGTQIETPDSVIEPHGTRFIVVVRK